MSFREGVLPRSAAHFPDAVVRLPPFLADDFAKAGKHAAFDRLERAASSDISVGCKDDFAINVELMLRMRAVADPHRL